jgi:hypothetical protein
MEMATPYYVLFSLMFKETDIANRDPKCLGGLLFDKKVKFRSETTINPDNGWNIHDIPVSIYCLTGNLRKDIMALNVLLSIYPVCSWYDADNNIYGCTNIQRQRPINEKSNVYNQIIRQLHQYLIHRHRSDDVIEYFFFMNIEGTRLYE